MALQCILGGGMSTFPSLFHAGPCVEGMLALMLPLLVFVHLGKSQ